MLASFNGLYYSLHITQSKSKTIITRSMLTISLIVFTDKLQGHVHTFYSKWYFITLLAFSRLVPTFIHVTEFTIWNTFNMLFNDTTSFISNAYTSIFIFTFTHLIWFGRSTNWMLLIHRVNTYLMSQGYWNELHRVNMKWSTCKLFNRLYKGSVYLWYYT